jgi:hypothetical protein
MVPPVTEGFAMTSDPLLWGAGATAKEMAISRRTLFTLTKSGLPCVRLPGCRRVLYDPRAVRLWIEQQRTASNDHD